MKLEQFKGISQAALLSLFLTLIYVAVLSPLRVLEIPTLKARDLFFQLRNQFTKAPSIVNQIQLIVIDDESIERSNQKWPFQRSVFASLVSQLSKAGARLIAFDFVFSGKSDPVDDFLLSQAIEQSGRTVLASFVDTNGNYILPNPEFRAHAKAAGIINKVQDRDLTVRRANMIYRDENGNLVGWPWELEIARAANGLKDEQIEISDRKIQTGHLRIPIQRNHKLAINYRFDFDEIAPVQLLKLLENPEITSQWNGKIILIGTTSKMLHDFYHTPLGLMPGVVINMNLLVNVMLNDYLKQLPWVLPVVLFFLFSFAGFYLSLETGLLTAFLSLSGASVLFLLVSFGLFLNNYAFDYSSPLIFGWLSFIGSSFYRYFLTLLENIQLRTKLALDPLTGLFNRRFLETTINQELEKGGELSVLMIDIDNFKSINDTYGHQFGDDVIKNVSFSIKEILRKGDSAVRYGGEEFCVLLPNTNKKEGAEVGEEIRRSIAARKISYVNEMTQFTVSVGVSASKTDHLNSSRALIRAADRALYHAKKTGKNKVSLYQND